MRKIILLLPLVVFSVCCKKNTPPVASFSVSPLTGNTDTLFVFDAGGSSDEQTATGSLKFRWDWESDGRWDKDYSAVPTASHRFSTAVVYNVKLEVMDEEGSTDQASLALTVTAANCSPVAVIRVTPETGDTGTMFTFDAGQSSDKETPLTDLQVRWDWENDGNWDTGYSTTKIATHQYSRGGNYDLKLEVKDGGGLVNTTLKTMVVKALCPIVNNSAISEITSSSATCGGDVTDDGGGTITARGVCWSIFKNPTITGSKTIDGTGTGPFTSRLNGLSAHTLYYVRAYATNGACTVYADSTVTFTTTDLSFTDSRDGNAYTYRDIGTQTWMTKNLAYLPAVSPASKGSETAIHYYVYGYEGTIITTAKAQANYTTYGVLYNWPAALTACPAGWHLPSDAEWTTLTDYLTNNGYSYGGSGSDIGKSMASTSGWTSYSTAGTVGNDQASNNRSGFTALPGGYRYNGGGFDGLGYYALFWSSSENGSYAWSQGLYYNFDGVGRGGDYRGYGFSVRCLQNK